jgi:hypothetical protein
MYFTLFSVFKGLISLQLTGVRTRGMSAKYQLRSTAARAIQSVQLYTYILDSVLVLCSKGIKRQRQVSGNRSFSILGSTLGVLSGELDDQKSKTRVSLKTKRNRVTTTQLARLNFAVPKVVGIKT